MDDFDRQHGVCTGNTAFVYSVNETVKEKIPTIIVVVDEYNENINNEDVRGYLKYLDSCKLKNSTISRRISTLRTFYNYLLDEGKVSSNIFKNVKNPKLEKKLPNYLNYSEMEELLNSIDTSTIEGLERRLLIEMFYSTGCRVSEIINIKIKDINLSEKSIKVMGKFRTVAPF